MVGTNLRFDDKELHKAVKVSSQRNRRSLNAEILTAIEYYLKNAPGAHYDPDAGKESGEERTEP